MPVGLQQLRIVHVYTDLDSYLPNEGSESGNHISAYLCKRHGYRLGSVMRTVLAPAIEYLLWSLPCFPFEDVLQVSPGPPSSIQREQIIYLFPNTLRVPLLSRQLAHSHTCSREVQ